MSDYFIFGNTDTRRFNAQVYRRNTETITAREFIVNSVPGKNGDVIQSTDRFPNREQRYQVVVNSANAEQDMNDLINDLLSYSEYQTLNDSFDTDVYMQAFLKDNFEVETVRERDVFKANITFNRKPQRFLVSGDTPIEIAADNSSHQIASQTMFPAKPLIIFKGYGLITFVSSIIGTEYIRVSDTGKSTDLCIDCEKMEFYEYGSASNTLNEYIRVRSTNSNAGKVKPFPVLSPLVRNSNGMATGYSYFTFATTFSEARVIPRWWKV